MMILQLVHQRTMRRFRRRRRVLLGVCPLQPGTQNRIKSEVMFNEPGCYQGRYNTNRDHNSGQRIRRGYDRTRRGNYNPRDNVGNI